VTLRRVLVELTRVEQRCRAVFEVEAGGRHQFRVDRAEGAEVAVTGVQRPEGVGSYGLSTHWTLVGRRPQRGLSRRRQSSLTPGRSSSRSSHTSCDADV
jgi:hypothetical protein